MFGFGKSKSSSPIFCVKNNELWSKNKFTPKEFGREITRLGFMFGVAQSDNYRKTHANTNFDHALMEAVKNNPGIIQLLYSNLIAGSFLCYAKSILNISDSMCTEIEFGIFDELKSTMKTMDNQVIENHTGITVNFATAIEKEIRMIDENSSVPLFLSYLHDLYPESNVLENMPRGLISMISGLGNRCCAICQNEFGITLQQS